MMPVGDKGQALVELPYAIVLICMLIILLVQPVIFLYTRMVLGQVAAGVCRIVATEAQTPAGSKEIMMNSYAADKLQSMPNGKAFYVKGSMRIEVKGNAKSEQIEVTVSVKQEPLPLMGLFVNAGLAGDVTVSGTARARGAQVGVQGSPRSAPQTYGFVEK